MSEESTLLPLEILELPKNSSTLGRDVFSSDLAILLCGMGMEKYIEVFKANHVSLDIFMGLTEEDLIALDIPNEDRQKILSYSLGASDSTNKEVNPPESAAEDLIIAKNLLSHSISLSVELKKMQNLFEPSTLNDYFLTETVKGTDQLKLLIDKCIQQTNKIGNSLYAPAKKEGVINEILLKHDLKLPEFLIKKLDTKMKLRKGRVFWTITSAIAVFSVGFISYYTRLS